MLVLVGIAVVQVPVVVLWWRDVRRVGARAPGETALPWSVLDLALLTGGPARAVDALLVGLVESGAARAEGGWVARAAGQARDAESAAVLGELPETWENLTNVRDRVAANRAKLFLTRADDLVRRGFLARSRQRVSLKWMCYGLLAPFVLEIGFIAVTGPHPGHSVAPLLVFQGTAMVVAWVLSAVRPGGWRGYRPWTALGRACAGTLADRLAVPGASQAVLTACGGLSAMTDEAMREAVRGRAPDGSWRRPLIPGTAHAPNRYLPVAYDHAVDALTAAVVADR
ncbi:TIGR04222 domain-containing membrane protein [Actinosynnema sp. NPDC050436]|uniref:TIGR04222 domain-containing membrane protein n=1 Tax=Actinosynnema sp. NPDC050436 TaxID=3155659 RepID=UPI003405324C